MPQHLTIKKAKRAALAAYEGRYLTAQMPRQKWRICVYRHGKKYGCAIGVSLTKSTMKKIREKGLNEGESVNTLFERGILTTDDPSSLRYLQACHDDWAMASREAGGRNKYTVEARQAFLACVRDERRPQMSYDWLPAVSSQVVRKARRNKGSVD